MKTVLNGRPMRESDLNRSLDEIAIRIAELSDDIMEIVQKIKESVELTKSMIKDARELSEESKWINLEKGLQKFKMQLIKKAPMYAVHDILKGEFKHKDVIQLMEQLYKAQQQRQTAELPPDIKELLKGNMSVSQFVLRRRVEAEKRGS